ncbi:hypothetical protein LTR78_010480 [Recurvomyces mirabilis]|uniref:Uncharacterized protein n=1 Tax=Recurvomyces mirabilis TaxID=574656 RepID=A0AAE0TQE8_9PEZI|nr:hypothetical protein LTR78_010480 [Recurvomyces mirabilis]
MAALRPSSMNQSTVQLAIVSFRLAAQLTSTNANGPIEERSIGDQSLTEIIDHGLDQALPSFEWQGETNPFGMVQYLTALRKKAQRNAQIRYKFINHGPEVAAVGQIHFEECRTKSLRICNAIPWTFGESGQPHSVFKSILDRNNRVVILKYLTTRIRAEEMSRARIVYARHRTFL